jgi:hypothetical protein
MILEGSPGWAPPKGRLVPRIAADALDMRKGLPRGQYSRFPWGGSKASHVPEGLTKPGHELVPLEAAENFLAPVLASEVEEVFEPVGSPKKSGVARKPRFHAGVAEPVVLSS